jgi:hypothetical protein
MTRRREPPDTKIVPFPDNWRGDPSAGAHLASWGPGNSVPAMTAGEVVLIESGNLIATFTLHVILRRGLGFYIRKCRIVKWGAGERVFPPQASHRITRITPSEEEGGECTFESRTFYEELLIFGSNKGAKEFEQAALAAARHAVAQARREQPAPNGNGLDHDGAPF